jgi:hypothetical protein
MLDPITWRWSKFEGAIGLGLVLLTMALALALGQDANWDLRNYHFYNAYGLLNSRFGIDVEPAGVQTYFTPALDLPFYVAVKVLKIRPLLISLCLAAFQGLNLWMIYRLVRLAVPLGPALGTVAGLAAAVTGAFGAAFYSEIGATWGDNMLSVIVLAALTVLIAGVGDDRVPSPWAVRVSGLLVGLATGAKLVAGMYAVGLLAAAIVVGGRSSSRITRAVNFSLFAGAGYLAIAGPWMWVMYRHFGSPFFPFFDADWRSPYAPVSAILAAHYKPHTAAETLFYPFFFLRPQTLTGELPFNDGRLALAYVSIVILAAAATVRKWRNFPLFESAADARILMTALFACIAYFSWLNGSPVYRYAMSLELLAPVLSLAAVAYWLRSPVVALGVTVPVCLLLVGTTHPPDEPRVSWGPTYFGVDEQALARYHDATIILSTMPTAYLVPFFPASASFVQLASNWPEMRTKVETRIRQAAGSGRLYVLDLPQEREEHQREVLASLGAALDPTKCQWTASSFEQFRVCDAIDRQAERPVEAASGAAPRTFEGVQDIVDCTRIVGWAWDQAHPDTTVAVDIYDGTRLIDRVPAADFRPDLQAAGKGNGRHAVIVPLPTELRDGQPHEVSLRFAGTSTALASGPKAITCAR